MSEENKIESLTLIGERIKEAGVGEVTQQEPLSPLVEDNGIYDDGSNLAVISETSTSSHGTSLLAQRFGHVVSQSANITKDFEGDTIKFNPEELRYVPESTFHKAFDQITQELTAMGLPEALVKLPEDDTILIVGDHTHVPGHLDYVRTLLKAEEQRPFILSDIHISDPEGIKASTKKFSKLHEMVDKPLPEEFVVVTPQAVYASAGNDYPGSILDTEIAQNLPHLPIHILQADQGPSSPIYNHLNYPTPSYEEKEIDVVVTAKNTPEKLLGEIETLQYQALGGQVRPTEGYLTYRHQREVAKDKRTDKRRKANKAARKQRKKK